MTAPNRKTSAALAGLIGTVTLAAIGALTTRNEGTVLHAYFDPAKVPTYCTGETKDVDWSRIYTKDECNERLRSRMAKDYAPAIIKCVPDFADPANQRPFGASLDLSYNVGSAAFCRSPIARAFNASQWEAGCRKIDGFYVRAGGRVLPGLVRRRREEAAFCLGGKA